MLKPRITVHQRPNANGRYPWLVTGHGWCAAGTGRTPEEARRMAMEAVAERVREGVG